MSGNKFWQNHIAKFKNSSVGFYSFGDPDDLSRNWADSCMEVFGKNEINIINFVYGTFGIENSRDILNLISSSSDGRVDAIGIFANVWTSDAQNVLLKVLENLPQHKIICLGSNEPHNFIETLKSRLFFVPAISDFDPDFCEKFVKSNVPERLKTIKKIIETDKKDNLGDNSDHVLSRKNLRGLAAGILFGFYFKSNDNVRGLNVLNKTLELLSAPAPSVRAIGEYLAISLPRSA